jgi:hypothetical protein
MTRRLLAVLAITFALASPAAAQQRRTAPPPSSGPSAGVRVGVSGDPDQFYFGGHLETSPLIDRLTFRPNVEIGFGDDETLVALNFEFAYWIPLRNQPWRVYVGGGPALIIRSFDVPLHGPDGSDTGGGFNFMIGLQHRGGLFTEFKVGAIDSPTVKFAVGYAFK